MYIDAVVQAVSTQNRDSYLAHAKAISQIFKEYGALKCLEYWGDDVTDGELTSFPKAVQKKDNETVALSWIVWPSRAARDAGVKNAMADPRLDTEFQNMPLDGKRAIYGGFEQIFEL